MSSYQADWFVDEEGGTHFQDNNDNNEDEEDEMDLKDILDADNNDNNNEKKSVHYLAGTSIGGTGTGTRSQSEMRQLQLAQKEKSDADFPDEMDTPEDISARTRFARYRALQSFRSSPWHPKENLPADYARIFQFENFGTAQRR